MTLQSELGIDEYLRRRLMPAEVAVPHVAGIEMYGRSIPAGIVGGDLVEYINFQQSYDIDAGIARAAELSMEYLDPPSDGQLPRNTVAAHVDWIDSKLGYSSDDKVAYRKAKGSEQLRIAEDLQALHQTAGVLMDWTRLRVRRSVLLQAIQMTMGQFAGQDFSGSQHTRSPSSSNRWGAR
jgi:hypothetical protein